MSITTIDNGGGAVGEDVIRRVIGSLGFSRDRVDRAVSCLLDERPAHDDGISRILSSKEVQQCLGISKSGLRRVMAAQDLVPIEITKRRIGFSAKDVAVFIESRRRRSPRNPGSVSSVRSESPHATNP